MNLLNETLRATCLEPELFGAAAMEAVAKDLMEMKVAELKEELAARDEPLSGNKAAPPAARCNRARLPRGGDGRGGLGPESTCSVLRGFCGPHTFSVLRQNRPTFSLR